MTAFVFPLSPLFCHAPCSLNYLSKFFALFCFFFFFKTSENLAFSIYV